MHEILASACQLLEAVVRIRPGRTVRLRLIMRSARWSRIRRNYLQIQVELTEVGWLPTE